MPKKLPNSFRLNSFGTPSAFDPKKISHSKCSEVPQPVPKTDGAPTDLVRVYYSPKDGTFYFQE